MMTITAPLDTYIKKVPRREGEYLVFRFMSHVYSKRTRPIKSDVFPLMNPYVRHVSLIRPMVIFELSKSKCLIPIRRFYLKDVNNQLKMDAYYTLIDNWIPWINTNQDYVLFNLPPDYYTDYPDYFKDTSAYHGIYEQELENNKIVKYRFFSNNKNLTEPLNFWDETFRIDRWYEYPINTLPEYQEKWPADYYSPEVVDQQHKDTWTGLVNEMKNIYVRNRCNLIKTKLNENANLNIGSGWNTITKQLNIEVLDPQRSLNEQEILSKGRLTVEQIDNYYSIAKDIVAQQLAKIGFNFDLDSNFISAVSTVETESYYGAPSVPANLYENPPWIDNNLI
jgi:hypothetical protein